MGNDGGAGSSPREYQPPVTPVAGWVADERTRRLRPLETAPHIGAFAPLGTGKTRKWSAQSAVLWPGPALVSSSKDDLMQMVASRRYGRGRCWICGPSRRPTTRATASRTASTRRR
jgi:hypothetical protein